MATRLNSYYKQRFHASLSPPMQFQRREGKLKIKKIQRKIRLRLFHILFIFLLLGGLFYSLQRAYLFLISWDNLNIKETVIVCSKPEVREGIQQILRGKNLGNILLLDINKIRETVAAHRWIKEVRVRKIFPSTLNIEVKERIPFALIKKENLCLIDKEGVELEKIESLDNTCLPLLVDSHNFHKDYKEKLLLAWECLSSLSSAEKDRIEALDLSDYENVTVQLKNDPTRLILGNDQFAQKLRLFEKYRARLEKFGELEYTDLRFPGRFYIKTKMNPYQNLIPNASEEAH